HRRGTHRARGARALMADENNTSKATRVDIGFSGGQVLSVRMLESAYEDLRKALQGAGADAGWHELKTEDSELSLHLAQVVYVRLDTEKHKVGF
ncbi:MAG TPA: hypothetical protein VJU60_06540, partial [Thermoleophilaceae bacterium]|nr:hypothetical protein [Thermoleophilaceae bacterium]